MFVLFPRLQLAEIEDQSWCPSWLREHSHSALARMWRTQASKHGSPAAQAGDILLENLGGPKVAAEYTFVDSCAGAGGPTPILEEAMNHRLEAAGCSPAKFVLTDLWPDLKAWRKIAEKSEHISYIEQPIDATEPKRIAEKECRIFNLCFHHFNEEAGRKVLRSAVESTDAFMIFEMTHRTLPAFLNTLIVVLSCLIFSAVDFWWSPKIMLFTYVIPIVPLFYFWDGMVSCIRTRTPEQTFRMLRDQKDLDLEDWDLRSGSRLVLPPFGTLYWYAGVKNVDIVED